MAVVWIVHRETRSRAALARLAAVGEAAIQAGPADPQLENASPADVVVLGVGADCEVELQFAHRFARRLAGARWILVCHSADTARVHELFDDLTFDLLAFPPDARDLRALVHSPAGTHGVRPLALSQRPARDALSGRFARWFADLELPELLRILDPRLRDVSLLVCGEPGTGRSLLARYVHTFSGTAGGDFLHLPCVENASAGDLLASLTSQGDRRPRLGVPGSVCLDDAHTLPSGAQRALAGWIEFGLPPHAAGIGAVRWIATVADREAGLEPALAEALGAFRVRIPPLRERPEMVAAFAADTAHAWCSARRERPRRFGEDAIAVLEEYPWPGNLRELEGVVEQTLLTSSTDPIRADDLQHQGLAFAPVSADELGAVLDEGGDVPEEWPVDPPVAAPQHATAPKPAAAATPTPDRTLPAMSGRPGEAEEAAHIGRLVGAVAHAVRNPLTSIRTFSELLPSQFEDREFREQFHELVGRDVDRIERVVQELARLADFGSPTAGPVDIAQLLEELLEQQRETIHARRLLVLKELNRVQPLVLADAAQLRYALETLLTKCFEIVPERGDVYFASKHHAHGLQGAASTRVLIRFHGPHDVDRTAEPVPGLSLAENALEFAVAEAIVRAHGGSMAIQAGDGGETVLVLDLPSPP